LPIDLVGVGFGPYVAGGYTPHPPKVEPSWELVAILLDAVIADKRIKCIWIYGALGANAMAVGLANQRGLSVIQGIWLDGKLTPAQNRDEIQAGIWLARHYPDTIKALICGNEVRLRAGWEVANSVVLSCLQQAREAGVTQPLSTQATWSEWCDETFPGEHFPNCDVWSPVAEAVDFVSANIYAWWENRVHVRYPCLGPPAVPEWTVGRLLKLMETYEPMGKAVIASEIGWPGPPNEATYVDNYGGAPCSVANQDTQVQIISQTFSYCRTMGLSCVLFQAHNEPWKAQDEGLDFGGHWGFCEEAPPYTCHFPYFPYDLPAPAWWVPSPSSTPAAAPPPPPPADSSPTSSPKPFERPEEPSAASTPLASPGVHGVGGDGASSGADRPQGFSAFQLLWMSAVGAVTAFAFFVQFF
jgi:exo-beta-1,3-glucanase (GH17 family)